jgi:phosphoribosylglycinamide formyltransferase-1
MMTKSRIAIFASGSGSNAEEFFKHFQRHSSAEVVLLLSNNASAYALERAKNYNIPTVVFTKEEFTKTQAVLDALKHHEVTHVVLAGFLWLIPEYLIRAFPHRVVNIHPALLPKFGGKGMYGMKVHESVRINNEIETGITIHEVNEKYDDGKVLFQATCIVDPLDTPDQIAGKVHQLEYQYYPIVVEKWLQSS